MNKVLVLFLLGLTVILGCVVNSSKPRSSKVIDRQSVQKYWLTPPFKYFAHRPDVLADLLDTHTVCLKNEGDVLPINNLQTKTSVITLGGNSDSFIEGLNLFCQPHVTQLHSLDDFTKSNLKAVDRCIISVHSENNKSATPSDWVLQTLAKIPGSKESILVLFGNAENISLEIFKKFNAIVLVPENHPDAQYRCAQKIIGALPITGKLDAHLLDFPKGFGVNVSQNGRLSFGTPEELGMKSSNFDRIDQIAQNGIRAGAYPGCQIVVSVKGKIIYREVFGNYTFDPTSNKVNHNSMYDIASITKIASSTLLTMKLHYDKKINLDEKLGTYIAKLTESTPYKNIVIREMMTHQAGLEPFIPFYKKMVANGKPLSNWFAENEDQEHTVQVADKMFMKAGYIDTMYAKILRTPLKPKKYLYSDLCYYFMQPIIEGITKQKQNVYLKEQILNPMGLQFVSYLPIKYYPKNQIVPTENDQYFRFQLLWGHVHDPGAAMLGGVAGHAGLFSNATDLASIMQLFLNNGRYAGQTFFDDSTVKLFTKSQYPSNKRGIGFDRPNFTGGGTCDELASQRSFGHSGFTGTLAWADPKNEVVFVFLSNRVHPSQDNWKIRDMNIRTNIQHAVFEIVNARFGS